ncbi:Reversion-inducing cysteine-rich protein with Kazal motifs [Hypsibius exemplaris]|uniref:Reversion-inducing cysteine-rich protein with Kazal motifs n=1 Tax=Hypsibius exemplaris TaxID=2072580 RepID=A0A1W0X5J1_HYPEX|nr:Reversion-inducing cysteine-rich protein with Kazal motifs [Hypsibius exemplaris]
MSRGGLPLIFTVIVCCVTRHWSFVDAEGIYPVCCENVSGNCRTACLKITLIDLATKPERHQLFTAHLEQHCESTKYLWDFMRCFNNTTRELQRGSNWPGRECCVFAKDPRCRVACIYAQSVYELEPVCWSSKESGLYDCFQSRDDAEKCCGFVAHRNGSSSSNVGCHNFCMELLPASVSPPEFSYSDLILLHPKCSEASEVVHCAWGLGKAPEHPLECQSCCNASLNQACRAACMEVSSNELSGIRAVEILISSGCGPPDPTEAFWICLLKSLDAEKSTSFIAAKQRPNPDTMKLHCCLKAATSRCRIACFNFHDPDLSTGNFDDAFWDCLEDNLEFSLRSCFRDVSLPCQTGCPTLGFCSHFNDRSDMSFRSCDIQSDKRAQRKFEQWGKEGQLALPNGTIVTLKVHEEECSQTWRGIICNQHIQPCDISNWDITFCHEDCVKLVFGCLKEGSQFHAAEICASLFPSTARVMENTTTICSRLEISASKKSEHFLTLPQEFSTTPCHPNPCQPNERCDVRRESERYANSTYECSTGCVVSSKDGTALYVASPEDKVVVPYLGADERVCYKVCTCTREGLMTSCEDMGFCDLPDGCWSNTIHYDHGSSFQRSCSRCVCLAGELICSAGYCLTEAQRDEERNALTGLPCSCPTDFNRVCGLNGKTYPTECSARCSGLSEYHFKGGICSLEQVCPYSDCGPDHWCVERSEVCLAHQNPCQQHTCVDIKTNCSEQPIDVACDTDGNEHSNLCSLLLAGRRFHYMGKCLNGCSSYGHVCGQNSETFESECAALADRVGTDYKGRCITVGGRIEKGLLNTCLVVEKRCPPRVLSNCVNVIPPDACCSVCAGALRILFSKRRLHRLAERNVLTITSRQLITELQRLIQSSSCQVLGYLTMENDIVVLVQRLNVTGESATLEEHLACVRESERLHYLINSQNPLITTNAMLWPLAGSKIIHAHVPRSCTDSHVMVGYAQHLHILFCIIFIFLMKACL